MSKWNLKDFPTVSTYTYQHITKCLHCITSPTLGAISVTHSNLNQSVETMEWSKNKFIKGHQSVDTALTFSGIGSLLYTVQEVTYDTYARKIKCINKVSLIKIENNMGTQHTSYKSTDRGRCTLKSTWFVQTLYNYQVFSYNTPTIAPNTLIYNNTEKNK